MISQDHRAAIEIVDDHIHIAVVEEIPDSEAARDLLFFERRTSLITGVAKGSIALIHAEKLWLAIAWIGWNLVNLRIDMAVCSNQVEPAVVIEIDECSSPFDPRSTPTSQRRKEKILQ